MQYRWDDYCLDHDGTLLTRQGQLVDVSRRVLACIGYLIKHRDRVIGHDELIREVWGHENATHHQLSQVVLAARRVLGGEAQRLIRTLPGRGFRWVGALTVSDAVGTHQGAPMVAPPVSPEPEAADADSSLASTPPSPTVMQQSRTARSTTRRAWMLTVPLLVSALIFVLSRYALENQPVPSRAPADDPLAALNKALDVGDFEQVRQGLAMLPPRVAETPDARIIEILLDLNLGRAARSLEKIEVQLAREEAIDDPVLRARLLIVKSKASVRHGKPDAETIGLIESALALIESQGSRADPVVLALALEQRGTILLQLDRLDEALRDLTHAHQLFERQGSAQAMLHVRSNTARVLMRLGRLEESLDMLAEIAQRYRNDSDRRGELHVLNTMTRIQMELLRWDDALSSSTRSIAVLGEVPDTVRRYRMLQLRAQVLTARGQLRLAASELEEASAAAGERKAHTIPAFHLLESGDAKGALRAVEPGVDASRRSDRTEILLDGKEGALLVWITAAQALAEDGGTMPPLPADARSMLHAPATALGRIARGRWLWTQGSARDAEKELRTALKQTRANHHLFRSTLAAEPLVGILLQRGDTAGAQAVLDELRAADPARLDNDYRFGVLQLRVAMRRSDTAGMGDAYRRVMALAGERTTPANIAHEYAARHPRAAITGAQGTDRGPMTNTQIAAVVKTARLRSASDNNE